MSSDDPRTADDLAAEDAKLFTRSRAEQKGRVGAAVGAALRDETGAHLLGANVSLPHLTIGAAVGRRPGGCCWGARL